MFIHHQIVFKNYKELEIKESAFKIVINEIFLDMNNNYNKDF